MLTFFACDGFAGQTAARAADKLPRIWLCGGLLLKISDIGAKAREGLQRREYTVDLLSRIYNRCNWKKKPDYSLSSFVRTGRSAIFCLFFVFVFCRLGFQKLEGLGGSDGSEFNWRRSIQGSSSRIAGRKE